jgi:hypothetical protein
MSASRMAVLSAMILAAPAAQAQDVKGRPAQPPVAADMSGFPKPAAEMAHLRLFEGSWACEGAMLATPFGPGGKMASTLKAQATLGGFWQSGTVKGTMPGMPPFEGTYHTTYDPTAKRYVMLWVDNTGAWAQTSATGWEGDRITFAGDSYMGGQKVASRDVFTRAGETSFKHSGELQIAGEWKQVFEETCRKQPAAAASPAK